MYNTCSYKEEDQEDLWKERQGQIQEVVFTDWIKICPLSSSFLSICLISVFFWHLCPLSSHRATTTSVRLLLSQYMWLRLLRDQVFCISSTPVSKSLSLWSCLFVCVFRVNLWTWPAINNHHRSGLQTNALLSSLSDRQLFHFFHSWLLLWFPKKSNPTPVESNRIWRQSHRKESEKWGKVGKILTPTLFTVLVSTICFIPQLFSVTNVCVREYTATCVHVCVCCICVCNTFGCICWRLCPKQSRMQHNYFWLQKATQSDEDLVLGLRAWHQLKRHSPYLPRVQCVDEQASNNLKCKGWDYLWVVRFQGGRNSQSRIAPAWREREASEGPENTVYPTPPPPPLPAANTLLPLPPLSTPSV